MRKRTTKKRGNPRTVRVKNFTGMIRLNPNKTVTVKSKRRKKR